MGATNHSLHLCKPRRQRSRSRGGSTLISPFPSPKPWEGWTFACSRGVLRGRAGEEGVDVDAELGCRERLLCLVLPQRHPSPCLPQRRLQFCHARFQARYVAAGTGGDLIAPRRAVEAPRSNTRGVVYAT